MPSPSTHQDSPCKSCGGKRTQADKRGATSAAGCPDCTQDSPKVPWPKVVYGVGTPAYPNEGVGLYKDGLPRGVDESEELEVRTYIPVSALLSDEVVEAAAKAEFESVESERWADLLEGEKEEWRKGQRASLKAAIEHVGGAK